MEQAALVLFEEQFGTAAHHVQIFAACCSPDDNTDVAAMAAAAVAAATSIIMNNPTIPPSKARASQADDGSNGSGVRGIGCSRAKTIGSYSCYNIKSADLFQRSGSTSGSSGNGSVSGSVSSSGKLFRSDSEMESSGLRLSSLRAVGYSSATSSSSMDIDAQSQSQPQPQPQPQPSVRTGNELGSPSLWIDHGLRQVLRQEEDGVEEDVVDDVGGEGTAESVRQPTWLFQDTSGLWSYHPVSATMLAHSLAASKRRSYEADPPHSAAAAAVKMSKSVQATRIARYISSGASTSEGSDGYDSDGSGYDGDGVSQQDKGQIAGFKESCAMEAGLTLLGLRDWHRFESDDYKAAHCSKEQEHVMMTGGRNTNTSAAPASAPVSISVPDPDHPAGELQAAAVASAAPAVLPFNCKHCCGAQQAPGAEQSALVEQRIGSCPTRDLQKILSTIAPFYSL